MLKKILLIVLVLTLVLTLVPVASVSSAVPNQDTLRIGTIGEPETVDPGWLYDTASSELVWNVYDTLLAFMVNETETNVIKKGLADHFEANLAYEWYLDLTVAAHPVFYFKIRGSHDHFITVTNLIPYLGGDPTSTIWMEGPTSEPPNCQWQIWKWEDNNPNGMLSAGDIVKMDKLMWEGPDVAPWLAFYVQEMLVVTPGFYVMVLKELPVPFQIVRTLNLPVGFDPEHPVSTVNLTEVSPVAGRKYRIVEWEDGMFGTYNTVLSVGDVIQMTRQGPGAAPPEYPNGWTRDYIVEAITPTQLFVKPCLTCWDVEYTMERWFVLDHTGGPQWMIYEVLTYPSYSWKHSDPNFYQKVDAAIETNCTWVWFTFAIPYSDAIFKQVMAQSWASIMYMDWAIDQGCWDGNWANYLLYHDPDESPLMDPEPVMCGTGPYFFVEWVAASHFRIERFEEHWQQWPARGCLGYLDVIIEEFISEWPTRKLMFLAGDLDFNYVPRQYKGDVEGKPGIRDIFPLEGVTVDGIFYNFNISLESRYLYAPYIEHLGYGVLKETGIPPDFFSDINVRKAFSYCIDYATFQNLAYLGESIYPVTPMPDAGVFKQYRHDPSWYTAHEYYLNLTKAEYYFKLAYGGGPTNPGEDPTKVTSPGLLWTTGFTLPVCYNTGNVPRRTIAEDYIETNVEFLNPKFHIDVYDVEWGTVYIPELFSWKLTLFVIGWVPDYLDPHNYMFTFMGSGGSFSYFQSYSVPHVDDLIDWGMKNTSIPIRQAIYRELEEIYIRDCPSVCTDQPWGRHFERTWMYGWYYNPIYPGGYFKHYWKDNPPGVITVYPVDISVKDTMSNVTQVIITAHTNPPIINDQKPYLKMVTGPGKGSRPRIAIGVHWTRATGSAAIPGFYAVMGLNLTRGTTLLHIEGVANFTVGPVGSSGTIWFILDLTTLTAKAYAGRWNFSAYTNVNDEKVYDSALANNTIRDDWGIVLGTGDVYWQDKLGLVDISDLVSMVAAVGSLPTDPNWNWYADIYQEDIVTNKVDISDLTALVPLVGITDYVDPV